METGNEKLVLDGNAFYEIDLTCLRAREKKSLEKQNVSGQKFPDGNRQKKEN